jgi:hypothetical protein
MKKMSTSAKRATVAGSIWGFIVYCCSGGKVVLP